MGLQAPRQIPVLQKKKARFGGHFLVPETRLLGGSDQERKSRETIRKIDSDPAFSRVFRVFDAPWNRVFATIHLPRHSASCTLSVLEGLRWDK
jgi:hypothetical protein